MKRVGIARSSRLADYAAVASLASVVEALAAEGRRIAPRLEGRTVWMVNSTAEGGGVAEMLPTLVSLLRDLGIAAEWAVIGSDDPRFFRLTKRIHNLIHGRGDPSLGRAERELFEAVNRRNAEVLRSSVRPGDILVVHDPQPMPLASILKAELELRAIWRCHIGLDEETPVSRAAWGFLAPYTEAYDQAIFSAPEYVPEFLAGRATLISPAIDPLTVKNRDLHLQRVVDILAGSGLAAGFPTGAVDPFPDVAQRLQPAGLFAPAHLTGDIGLLGRPVITQISRWDRLKGYGALLEAFARLKATLAERNGRSPRHRRCLERVRLVLAGPDPESIQDDPEGQEVLDELRRAYVDLPSAIQQDVAIITLPMRSRRANALMVNALQRSSTIVAQNSLREGFGLSITEAMWKRVPVLTNSRACGPRHQVRDRLDGWVVSDPEDTRELAEAMDTMLADTAAWEAWGDSARRRVHEHFLVFRQVQNWLRLLAGMV